MYGMSHARGGGGALIAVYLCEKHDCRVDGGRRVKRESAEGRVDYGTVLGHQSRCAARAHSERALCGRGPVGARWCDYCSGWAAIGLNVHYRF